MSENEVERIRKDLEKHGFPLEIRVSQLLKNNGWDVADKYFFVDEETAKQERSIASQRKEFLTCLMLI